MTELEKVEKLREKADVSFLEAKEALDNSGGDILDALIYLEKQGKSTVPSGGGFFSGGVGASMQVQHSTHGSDSGADRGESFSDLMKRLGRFCLKMFEKGNSNFLDAIKGDEVILSCPVTALVLLIIFFFWVTIPLIVISLFFGLRYQFRGADLGRDSVNRVMDGASEVVEDVKKSFTESANNTNAKETEE
jgi:hypothetical protein